MDVARATEGLGHTRGTVEHPEGLQVPGGQRGRQRGLFEEMRFEGVVSQLQGPFRVQWGLNTGQAERDTGVALSRDSNDY